MQRLEPMQKLSLDALGESEGLELEVARGEPLSRHSSLRIGGPAAYWVEVETERALRSVLEWASRRSESVYVVGLGSNALFPDEGIDGVVVRLAGALSEWSVVDREGEEAEIRVGGGTVNAHLVGGLLEKGWVGAEFLRLVPGTFGGAVAMNAGTKEAELGSILVEARCLSAGDGGHEERRCGVEGLGLRYRESNIRRGEVVVEGRIRVERGDVDGAREEMERDRERRDETQPYKLASAGSTFANPEGDYAGRLLDEAGMKGVSVGDARVSPTHANFFINDGEATAREFLELMARARSEVREKFGIELRPEVDFVGFEGMERLREFEESGGREME